MLVKKMFFPEDLYIARVKTSDNVDFRSLEQVQVKIYLDLLQRSHHQLQQVLIDLQEVPGMGSWKFHSCFDKTIKDFLWEIGILYQKAVNVGLQGKKWEPPKKPRFLSFASLLEHLRKGYMDLLNQVMVLQDPMLDTEVVMPDDSKGKISDLLSFVIEMGIKYRGQIELIIELYRLMDENSVSD